LSLTDVAERGQVFAQAGDPTGLTYEDVKGVVRPFEVLQADWTPMMAGTVANTSEPYLARTSGQEWDFQFAFALVQRYWVRIMGRRVGGPWEPLQTTRSDTGALAAEHEVLSGQTALLLQTPAGFIRDQCRVEVKVVSIYIPSVADQIVGFCRAI